jgi:peptidoglycan hydrolase-like protein with peptidoglycan-binding domain
VLTLQRLLHVYPSGYYGAVTAHAVALWQLHHGLPHTGVADLRTAVAMHLARAPAPPGLPYAGPGERGPHVLTLQRLLHVHLSGYYGAVTAHAVALWQLHHGLPHTGIADLRTARAMHLVR